MTTSHELLEALPVPVYTTDAEGRLTFYNQAAADLWGYRPPLGALWCGSLRIYRTDGTLLPHEDCPMAVAVQEGRPVRGVEALIERPDGSRVPVRPYPTPLRDAEGRITGAINVFLDVSDQHRMAEEGGRMSAIVSSSDDAIISKTLEGRIVTWNPGAERIFGYLADEMIGQPIAKIIPPHLLDEEKVILAKLAAGERIDHYETIRLAKDGRLVDISLTVSPVRDAGGRVIGASKVARDVSDRKRSEEVQRLLLNELNHRIKNTLATVQAIAGQTLRRSPSPADFVDSFNGRIQALARAHMLLTGAAFQSAEVSQLVREQLLLGGPNDHRISYSGPSLSLDADAALHLALVLHELGTNARKHGALSSPNGSVSIRWEMRTNGGRKLHLDWRESGGPAVRAPASHGFGSVLIERSLQAHGGEAVTLYAEDGVSCAISLPIPTHPESLTNPPPRPATSLKFARPPQADPSRLTGKRILVVEDEALISMELVDYLEEAGCKVVGPAQSFDEAKRLIEAGQFDGALLDGNLAGRPVDELAAALTRQNAPFVFVTGYGREALPASFQDGAIIEKPFTRDQVLAAIDRFWTTEPNIVPIRHGA